MSSSPLLIEIVITFFISIFLGHRYGDWGKHNVFVTSSVFVAWFFSFLVIFILPLDVSTTAYLQCVETSWNFTDKLTSNGTVQSANEEVSLGGEVNPPDLEDSTATTTIPFVDPEICARPWAYASGNTLISLWRLAYWTTQLLTWFIFPVLQKYTSAGDFTVMSKLKSSLRENLIFYGIGAFLFTFFFLYLAIMKSLTFASVRALCITASNIWGQLLLTVLLGYGLVKVPRSFYEASKVNSKLNYLYFKVAKLSAEKCESEERLDDALELIEQTYEAIRKSHLHLQKYMNIILTKCSPDWSSRLIAKYEDVEEASFISSQGVKYTENDLVSLHRNIIRATQVFHRTQLQWTHLIDRVFELEDVQSNQLNPSRLFTRAHGDTTKKPWIGASLISYIYSPRVEWYWKCRYRSTVYEAVSLLLALFSFLVVWSEMLFSVTHPNLSVFALLHNSARSHENYFLIQVISIATIAYLCFCTYYTVFKMRIFNFYYLASHHQTDEHSLIFCALLLCRLTPPLCLNFLSLMHLDSSFLANIGACETAFSSIMGHMDVIESIASNFRTYLPIVMCLFCIATFLDVGSRVLHFVGIEQFIIDDEMTADLIKDGSELVKRERNKRFKQKRHPRWSYSPTPVISAHEVSLSEKSQDFNSNRQSQTSLEVKSESFDLVFPSRPPVPDLLTDEIVPPYPTNQSQPRRNLFDDL